MTEDEFRNQERRKPVLVDGIPRRNRIDLATTPEKAIRDAMAAVENAGAHPFLTKAVTLLGEAKEAVADYIELPAGEK